MNKDRIQGSARETLRAVKSTAGRMAGDAQTQAEGLYDQAAGAVQGAYGKAKDIAGDGADQVARVANDAYGQARDVANRGADTVAGQMRTSPLSSALTIGAICFAMGWMLRGRA